MDWFEAITGFREQTFEATQARLSVVDGRLHSASSDRACAVGQLETPTLAELRLRTSSMIVGQGLSQVSCLQGDARRLHGDAANANALFQVASQFNRKPSINHVLFADAEVRQRSGYAGSSAMFQGSRAS